MRGYLLLAICAAHFCCCTSNNAMANYVGLGVRLHTVVNAGGALRNVWRIYAVFSNPDDYLLAVAGSNTLGNMVIQSRNASMSGPGSNFFNAGGGNLAPLDTTIATIPDAQWDTFATIGADINIQADPLDDLTSVSPGFPTFLTGNSFSSNNLAWYILLYEQGRAGGPYGHAGPFLDGFPVNGLGVLMMQLTVNAGDHVRGTVAIMVYEDIPLAGSQVLTFMNQTFASVPAAPSFLALLGLAGFGSRRRFV